MRTPNANRDEIKTNSLTIVLTDAEKRRIEAAAIEKGMSMSLFVRLLIKDALDNNDIDKTEEIKRLIKEAMKGE